MTVYLLHFHGALQRGISPTGTPLEANHYIGFTDDLVGRVMQHAEGQGARFTQVCHERGIDFALARTWDGAGRRLERRLKNYKKARLLCPICSADALRRMNIHH